MTTTIPGIGLQRLSLSIILGGLESMGGMLLFGLSTAFLFYIIREMFQSRLKSRNISFLHHDSRSAAD